MHLTPMCCIGSTFYYTTKCKTFAALRPVGPTSLTIIINIMSAVCHVMLLLNFILLINFYNDNDNENFASLEIDHFI